MDNPARQTAMTKSVSRGKARGEEPEALRENRPGLTAAGCWPSRLRLLRSNEFLQYLLVANRADVNRQNEGIDWRLRAFDELLLCLYHGRVLLLECEPARGRYLLLNLRVQRIIGRHHVEAHRREKIMRCPVALRREHVDGVIAGAAFGQGSRPANSGDQTQIAG